MELIQDLDFHRQHSRGRRPRPRLLPGCPRLRPDEHAEYEQWAARAELESKGVTFLGDTFDTGVCHMAIFAGPDGSQLMLRHRYAP